MSRLPDVLVDPAPLSSTTVDVPLRVGWLLRTCRMSSPATVGLTGQAFAAEIGVNPALVTKWEKAVEDIDVANISAYERVLGLPEGWLRGTIELARRRFRYPVSPRVTAPRTATDLASLSELTWPAMHGEPSGADWLHFADALNADGALVLPDFTAGPVVDRLISELARAVGPAFLSRYEAAARLRVGPYRTVVLRSLLAFVLAEDSQVAVDPLEVAAELPSRQLGIDLCRLLQDRRYPVFDGASRALGILFGSGLPTADRQAVLDALVEAYDAVSADPWRHRRLSETLRLLPDRQARDAWSRLSRPMAPLPARAEPLTRSSAAYQAARDSARRILRSLDAREDPVLERVLFEALFDPVWVKRYVAAYFLMALPYCDLVETEVARLSEESPLPEVRRGAARLLMHTGGPSVVGVAEQWATQSDPAQRVVGLVALARWADDPDPVLLDGLLDEDCDTARRAVTIAGMSGSPILTKWATDDERSQEIRAGARWWLRHGTRLMT